jgi:hypothetical protein
MAAELFRLKLGSVLEFKNLVGVSDISDFSCLHLCLTYTYFQWNFTLGLSLSSLVDVMVTASLFILLQKSRTGADA